MKHIKQILRILGLVVVSALLVFAIGSGLGRIGVGLPIYFAGFDQSVTTSTSVHYGPSGELLNVNPEALEIDAESIQWKVVSRDDYETNISLKFTLANPTSEDIFVYIHSLAVKFIDAEGFAIAEFHAGDAFTVPANGTYEFTAPYQFDNAIADQIVEIEVLGVRSK